MGFAVAEEAQTVVGQGGEHEVGHGHAAAIDEEFDRGAVGEDAHLVTLGLLLDRSAGGMGKVVDEVDQAIHASPFGGIGFQLVRLNALAKVYDAALG